MSKIDELQTQNSDLKKQLTQSEPLKSQMADMSIQVDESLETQIQMENIDLFSFSNASILHSSS
jgi:hypothetical protein